MRLRNTFIFALLLCLLSCKKDPAPINCDNVSEIVNTLFNASVANRYIKTIENQGDLTLVTYADGQTTEISSSCVLSFETDPENWTAKFVFKDDIERANLKFIGNFEVKTVLNPTGYTPLNVALIFEQNFGKLRASIEGKDGGNDFVQNSIRPSLSMFGLYPSYNNTIYVELLSSRDVVLGTTTVNIQTSPLPSGIPSLEIIEKETSAMEPGFNFVSSRVAGNPNIPFMFDDQGNVRWYLDFREHPVLNGLYYDVGMERLENGNLYFGHFNTIFEMQWDGTIVNSWPFPYRFHHNVQEKPNGNFLVTVSNPDATHLNGTRTIEDHIIEIERSSGGVLKVWDLREILDENRVAWANELQTDPIDWAHANAVIYDPNDNTIIVSCRKQGLLKVDYEDNIKWIMGPHKGWNQNRKGEDLNQFLLQPLDANSIMIPDPEVKLGNQNHPDFEWSWYQHAPLLLENGNLLVFDNGDNRNFNFEGPYSRAVEYDINSENKTIQQIWSYGKERGASCYSHIVSDVDVLSLTKHILFAPGAVLSDGEWKGKIIEVNPSTNQVVFEANINSGVYITFHRVERMSF